MNRYVTQINGVVHAWPTGVCFKQPVGLASLDLGIRISLRNKRIRHSY